MPPLRTNAHLPSPGVALTMSATTSPRATRILAKFIFLLLLWVSSTPAAKPKTLMILVNWRDAGAPMDTLISLKVFQPASEIKLVNGGNPSDPLPTAAYVRERFASWYALPGFNSAEYVGGRVRFSSTYTRGWYQNDSIHTVWADSTLVLPDTQTVFRYTRTSDSTVVAITLGTALPKTVLVPAGSTIRIPKLYVAAANAGTEILNNPPSSYAGMYRKGGIDNCIDTLVSDTVWIRFGSPSQLPGSHPMPSQMTCFDHNPFFPNRAAVNFFNPWTGSAAWAVVNGVPQILRSGLSLSGLVSGALWTVPEDTSILSVEFRITTADGKVHQVDSSGAPYHVGPKSLNFIVPKMGTLNGQRTGTVPPIVVFAWANPWVDRVAELQFGGEERIRGSWNPQGWFAATVYGRPTKAGLVSYDGDSSTPMMDVPPTTANKVDTIWLTPRPTDPVSIRLEGKAYDYRLGNRGIRPSANYGPMDSSAYFPFSQTTNSWLLKGLVNPRLGADGYPVWTGRSICGVSYPDSSAAPCKDAGNAIRNWFHERSQDGHRMNAIFPISLNLSDLVDGSLAFQDSLFFPLDSFRLLPGTSTPNPFFDSLPGKDSVLHNFGYCIELRGEAQIAQGSKIAVKADDDTWIFVDSILVIDLGGQHAIEQTSANLDRVKFDLPLMPLVSIDIFHCERHVDESGMFLSSNFPIYPVGTRKTIPATSSIQRGKSAMGPISLRSISNTLSVTSPAGQPWTLELRGLDGKLQKAVTGSGASLVNLTYSGISIALLRSGNESVTGRFVGTR